MTPFNFVKKLPVFKSYILNSRLHNTIHLNVSIGIKLVGCGTFSSFLTAWHLKRERFQIVQSVVNYASVICYFLISHTKISSRCVETATINCSVSGNLVSKS